MKDHKSIDKLFDKSKLNKAYHPTNSDWLDVRDIVISEKKDRKLPLIWLLSGLLIGLLFMTLDFSLLNEKNTEVLVDHSKNQPIVDDNTKEGPQDTELSVSSNILNKELQGQTSSSGDIKENVIIATNIKSEVIQQKQVPYINETLQKEISNAIEKKVKINHQNNIKKDLTSPSSSGQNSNLDKGKPGRIERNFSVLDVLSIEPSHRPHKYCISDRVSPVKRKAKTPTQLSIIGGPGGKVFGLSMTRSIVHHNKLVFFSGLNYQFWNIQSDLINRNQESFSFGVSNRNAILQADRIHYVGFEFGVYHQIWRNLFAKVNLNPLYRVNVQGQQSYWQTNQDYFEEKINIENNYSKDFNLSISGQLSYQFNKVGLGIGYTQLLNNPYHLPQDAKSINVGQLFFSVNTSF